MKKFLATAVTAAFIACSFGSVQAEEQDVAQIKCSEFLQSGDSMPLLLMWIDGYLSAASDDTVCDDAYIEELGSELGNFCKSNPDATIWDAMQSLGN